MDLPRVRKSHIPLSHEFFTVVFNDRFMFNADTSHILASSTLSDDEKQLAMRVYRSGLYSAKNWEHCADVAGALERKSVFRWASNSEGPLIFSSKIWYLLLARDQDVDWFAQRMKGIDPEADGNARPRERAKKKKQRATVITPTAQGILLTEERNGRYLLPGGHVERNELPIAAAARELHEETRLTALQLHALFEYTSEHYQHHVFLAPQCEGKARASSDAVALHFLSFDDLYAGRFPSALFHSSAEILRQFAAQHGAEFLR